jgi:L-ascorbate metabolism protein UlaG (beta-lactamase superfamily)
MTLLSPSSYIADVNFDHKNKMQLLRHATLVLTIKDKIFLIDPMLSAKNEMDPVQNCGNYIRIPMVDLPLDETELNQLLQKADAVFVTHTHRDHWDEAAQKRIEKNKLIFCQPSDEAKIREQGFTNVEVINDKVVWNGISIYRTPGRHGAGVIGEKMGTVSGFIFDDGIRKIYVAGDTVWCDEVKEILERHQPEVIIVNAGGAQFLVGGPITMIPEHILRVHDTLPQSKLIAVHMDTVNHCFVKRTDLDSFLRDKRLRSKVTVPLDGQEVQL